MKGELNGVCKYLVKKYLNNYKKINIESVTIEPNSVNMYTLSNGEEYKIVEHTEPKQILSTKVDNNENRNSAFRKLFNYIKERKIPMTRPVFEITTMKEKRMIFFLNKKGTNPSVGERASGLKLDTFKPGRFIVIRYSGKNTDKKFGIKKKKLLEMMNEDELTKKYNIKKGGRTIKATYDGPRWTEWPPWKTKRNEVLIEIE